MRRIVNRKDVDADTTERRTIWRLLYPETLVQEFGAVAGIAEYYHSQEALPVGPAHSQPEFYYVVKGTGIIRQGDVDLQLQTGDAFVVPPGMPHSLWSTVDDPLVTFYVALTEPETSAAQAG